MGLHRTAKLFVDDGRVATLDEAEDLLRNYVLQVDVGPRLNSTPAGQASLLTTVNTAARAFLGGVHVRLVDDPVLTEGWFAAVRLSEAIVELGGIVTVALETVHPTVVVGHPGQETPGSIVLHTTWRGWSAGVVETDAGRLDETSGFALAGVLSGGIAVSEAFQHRTGSVVAGRRDVGLSLWRPEVDWRAQEAFGPRVYYLPSRIWMLGLGHLGQAYSWALGLLPYADPRTVEVVLQDTDFIVKANLATSLLARRADEGIRKTRTVARRLEALGFRTSVVERLFDGETRRARVEPGLALVGFDDPTPRRALGSAGFDRIVDGGLGRGPHDYLDFLIHSFPSGLDPATAFGEHAPRSASLAPAYESEIRRRMEQEGIGQDEARCGVVEVAGRAVGASFVGAATSAFVLGEALRELADGPRYEVVSIDLRDPAHRDVAPNTRPGPPTNTGYTLAR